MINEADLRELSAAQRRQLARSLAVIDYPDPLLEVTLARGRKLGALFSIVACTVLVGWIIVLLFTLHRSFHAHYWRLAWVGFDIVLLFGFAATGWAFWRGRQIVIACLLVTGTLLCCDAWFDVILDSGTRDIWGSLASAVFIELPLAFLMFNAARRLIRVSGLAAVRGAGAAGYSDDERRQLPIWKIPLAGVEVAREKREAVERETGDRSGGKSHSEPR